MYSLTYDSDLRGQRAMSRICGSVVVVSVLATVASTLSVYPHQLAYFNELAGGPEAGYRHLLHSNLDWGQDFLIVRDWIRRNTGPGDFHQLLTYAYDPRDIGLPGSACCENSLWLSSRHLPRGTYIVSCQVLYGDPRSPSHVSAQCLEELRHMESLMSCCYTVRVYQLD